MHQSKTWILAAALVIPPETAFKLQQVVDGIEVSFAKTSESEMWVRGIGKISSTHEDLFGQIMDVGSYANVFAEHLKISKILEQDSSKIIAYFVWPLPFPMSNRDAVVEYRFNSNVSKKESVITWQSATHPMDVGKELRIQNVMGRTLLREIDLHTQFIDYVYYGDLGGDLAGWIKRRAWLDEPVVYIQSLQKALILKKHGQ